MQHLDNEKQKDFPNGESVMVLTPQEFFDCFRMNLNGNLIDTHIVISFLVDISYLLCKQRYTKMTE